MPLTDSIPDKPCFRHPLKQQRYRLTLEGLPNGPVYVRAIPNTPDYYFDNPEDARFNLSDHVGVRDDKLEWGLTNFEANVSSTTVRIRNDVEDYFGDRFLSVKLKPNNGNEPLQSLLNLDDYLDLVESYDPRSGELKAKLGKKPKTTKRSIILCFDGTSNHFSNQNTNVVKLVELLKKDDPEQQLVYYQPGIGTYSSTQYITSIGKSVASVVDQCVAFFLYQHVIDGYRYLMQTYRAGDQISIFGFSRGAYTARALAGMLHSVGLLPRHNLEQAPFAYEVYSKSAANAKESKSEGKTGKEEDSLGSSPNFDSSPESTDPRAFKRAFCIQVTVTFLGVWDTVGSVGALKGERLPWIHYNPSVKNFRQALALDENRGNFIPSLWDHSRTNPEAHQSAIEVWFKGGHTDIGGGAPPTEEKIWDMSILEGYDHSASDFVTQKPGAYHPRLSNITLRWMVRQCLTISEARILFDPTMMCIYRASGILEKRPVGADKKDLDRLREALDTRDIAQQPFLVYEQNSWKGWGWWLLDMWGVPKPDQTNDEKWDEARGPKTVKTPNMGAPRIIQFQKDETRSSSDQAHLTGKDCVRMHSSVYTHIRSTSHEVDEKNRYAPRAIWANWPSDRWPLLEDSLPNPDPSQGMLKESEKRQLHLNPKPEPKKGLFGLFS